MIKRGDRANITEDLPAINRALRAAGILGPDHPDVTAQQLAAMDSDSFTHFVDSIEQGQQEGWAGRDYGDSYAEQWNTPGMGGYNAPPPSVEGPGGQWDAADSRGQSYEASPQQVQAAWETSDARPQHEWEMQGQPYEQWMEQQLGPQGDVADPGAGLTWPQQLGAETGAEIGADIGQWGMDAWNWLSDPSTTQSGNTPASDWLNQMNPWGDPTTPPPMGGGQPMGIAPGGEPSAQGGGPMGMGGGGGLVRGSGSGGFDSDFTGRVAPGGGMVNPYSGGGLVGGGPGGGYVNPSLGGGGGAGLVAGGPNTMGQGGPLLGPEQLPGGIGGGRSTGFPMPLTEEQKRQGHTTLIPHGGQGRNPNLGDLKEKAQPQDRGPGMWVTNQSTGERIWQGADFGTQMPPPQAGTALGSQLPGMRTGGTAGTGYADMTGADFSTQGGGAAGGMMDPELAAQQWRQQTGLSTPPPKGWAQQQGDIRVRPQSVVSKAGPAVQSLGNLAKKAKKMPRRTLRQTYA